MQQPIGAHLYYLYTVIGQGLFYARALFDRWTLSPQLFRVCSP
jgi:hypothetical protein